jgi:hypothetical protein
MATQSQIQNSIDQIQTNANYTANQLRPLLTSLLGSVYSPFYINSLPPTAVDNQTSGYKAGSFGVDTTTNRYYVCQYSDENTATWFQITLDKGVEIINANDSTVYTLQPDDALVIYNGSQTSVTVELPTTSNIYPGKKITVYFQIVTTGTGVAFYCPELVPYTVLGPETFVQGSTIDFVFNGSTWVAFPSSTGGGGGAQDLQSVYNQGNSINGYDVRIDNSSSDNILISDTGNAMGGTFNVSLGRTALDNYNGDYGIGIGIFAGYGSAASNNIIAIGTNAANANNQNSSISIGDGAGFGALSGANCISLGYNCGSQNQGTDGIFIGPLAATNLAGDKNIAIGTDSGSGRSGNQNISIGNNSGKNTTGNFNINIGTASGSSTTTSIVGTISIGSGAGGSNEGDSCLLLGNGAGETNSGNTCVIIGDNAGQLNTLSNQFIISNSNLPSFATSGAAIAALSGGASGNTYLYFNSGNSTIEAVRIP